MLGCGGEGWHPASTLRGGAAGDREAIYPAGQGGGPWQGVGVGLRKLGGNQGS